jgi:AcrR family transcriptional regulator
MTLATLPPDTERPLRTSARAAVIQEAALELVAEVGYDRLSMDALAERAGVSKATIYRHWSGKAGVVADAVRDRHCAEVEVVADQGSLRADLLAQLSQLCGQLETEEGALIVGLIRAMHADAELGSLMRAQVLQAKSALLETLIERAQARGEVPSGADCTAGAEAMTSVVFCRLLLSGEPLDAGFSRWLVDQIVLPILTTVAGGPQEPTETAR